ncbi:MAG TPA: ROK family protein [Victivallales bacterium]|nr:ROK family protein [Victivallales bacterium]
MKSDSKKAVLGVDLGGTNIRIGKVVGNSIVKTISEKLPDDKDSNADSVINTINKVIYQLMGDDVAGIGIGIPSVLDRKNGIIYDVQNIPSWKEIHLKDILEKEFDRSVFINNDANCFAIGERIFGKGKKYENFVGLAIGTGIGGGIINNGSLLKDVNCGAGEFGEMKYLDARYEDYCSSFFFKSRNVDGFELYNLAMSGNLKALETFNEFGTHLGNMIKTVLFAVDPEAIIIGGSIADSHIFFENSMWNEIRDFTYPRSIQRLKIEYSELGNSAQILGAAALYIDSSK